MASINTIVKRKQYLWLGIVVERGGCPCFHRSGEIL